MPRNAQQAMATIDNFINAVGASVKSADDPLSEPGGYTGETKHPVKNVDDRLQTAPEGERSKENSKDVKEDQGKPSVENAPEAKAASVFDVAGRLAKRAEGAVSTPGSAEDDHIQIGTKKTPTGEDPTNETSSAKGGKDDKKQGDRGGTSHPASTENDSLDGHKYALDANMSLEKLASVTQEIGNNLCAQLTLVGRNGAVKQANGQPTQTNGQPVKSAAAPQLDAALAQQVGWEMAGLINGTMDKAAADQMVQNALYEIVKTASDAADLYIAYARQFFSKKSDHEEEEGGGEGGGLPGVGGGGGEGGEGDMLAALGGGGGGDPVADMAGGGGMGGGEMGGGGNDEEAMALARVLEQLGVTPEMLQQMIAAEAGGGGGGGGAPEGMGGGGLPGGGAMGGAGGGGEAAPAPVPGGGGGGEIPKAAADRQSTIKTAEMQAYITELVSRSRARRK